MNGVSKNRNFIMGLAIIWIALYHLPSHTTIPVLGFLQDIGYGGVDIFVLLSGFGVYHSLKKDSNAGTFLGRRLSRLLPSYLPFIIMWMLVRFLTYQIYFTEVCGNLTMTGWWNGDSNQFNWYVDGILLFYILAPYIYGWITGGNACESSKNGVNFAGKIISSLACRCIIAMAISLVISMAFLHGQLLMAMSRLPLFVLGMITACSMDDEKLGRLFKGILPVIIWNVIMLIGFSGMYYCLYLQDRLDRWHYGLWWYPFILIAPGLVIDLGFIKTGGLTSRFISTIGTASFEIFLWHLFIFETAQAKSVEGTAVWTVLFVAAFLIGLGYEKLIKILFKKRI